MRPALEVADVFRRHAETYRANHGPHLGRVERRVMAAIEACRTAVLGGHVEACDDCGHSRVAYNSCRNRHCPKCQGLARAEWLAARQAELLPVSYFHVVFTVPAPVAEIAFQNKAAVYAILFDAGALQFLGDIFGTICPKLGKGAGLVMPFADTAAMQAHLEEISAAVDPAAHAILILDQAGWHMSTRLEVPGNVTLLPLPPRSPELNPVENVWQFMRQNWLSNRVFQNYDDIVAHCCEAWNKLTDQPWRIMSLGLRQWAHEF